jgi:ribosomal protein S18 acetylase RimI-like enzyme
MRRVQGGLELGPRLSGRSKAPPMSGKPMGEAADEKLTIRPVTPADLTAVRYVLVTTWHATYDVILGEEQVEAITAAWHSTEALEQKRVTPGGSFLLAETDGRILATAFARPGADGRVTLSLLYVLPEMQRRGIGRKLLAASLAAFPQARTIQLEVEPRNVHAIAFYERAGFRVVDEGGNCGGCGSGIRHLVMEKRFA